MKKILIVSLMSLFLSGVANAGSIGIGVTGSLAGISAEGTEADKAGTADASMRTATAGEIAVVPSVFLEYSFDNGFTLGYDATLGKANVSNKKLTRTDDSSEAAQDGDRSAQAELDKVHQIYAELPLHAGLYAKAGFVQMDVNTLDKSTSTLSGSYGNTTVDGYLWGLGYKNTLGTNAFYKVEGTSTNMDSMSFLSTTTDKGNKITADLDVLKATFAIGFSF
ncbi:hypothetical protein N9N34_00635 [Candidatus Pelagibacter bacterium]|nr:hypothetical protein [Candidatus Pelagibacter bacterium]